MILHSKIGTLNSKEWLNSRARNEWLSINDIPTEIFWSVWEFIETSQVELHKDKPLYRFR